MTPARLCFVVESGTDVRLVDGLAERFELTVIARKIPGGVEISRTPERQFQMTTGPSSRLGFARLVQRELAAAVGRFDACLVQGYALAALGAGLAARRTGIPTTLLVCSPVERYYAQRRLHAETGKPYRLTEAMGMWLLARMNARVARQYVVLSRHLGAVVQSHGARGRTAIVPVYGVDTTRFAPGEEPRNELRSRRGLPPKGAVIFFSSRVAPEKDAETLLAAIRGLLDAGRDLWLLHRGGGFRSFLDAARGAGVVERVIATDAVHPVKELPLDYQASDLLVQASREEGLGFSPLEALACGTPVVATAVGGLAETIVDGQTGWTYPVGNVAALTRSIADALDHPAEAARRAAAGRQMVLDQYEARSAFDRLAAVLLANES